MVKETIGKEFRSNTFFYFLQECKLAESLLNDGINNLLEWHKDLYAHNGVGYGYRSFFSLSISIERLSKLALIFHYAKENSTSTAPIALPNGTYIRSQGHELCKLFNTLDSKLKVEDPGAGRFSLSPASTKILNFLSNFAVRSRYENLDKLSGAAGSKSDEPLKVWEEILREIINSRKVNDNLCMDKELYRNMENVATRIFPEVGYYNSEMTHYNKPSSTTNLVSYVKDYIGEIREISDLILASEAYRKYYPLVLWHVFEIINPIIFVLKKWARESFGINEKYFYLPWSELIKEKYSKGIQPCGENSFEFNSSDVPLNLLDVPDIWDMFSDRRFEALEFPKFLECL